MNTCCPEMIVRAASPKEGVSPCIIELLPSPNTANLARIECNVLEAVLLRLLLCKDENPTGIPDDCLYPEHRNSEARKMACGSPEAKLAQIYIRHEKINVKSRSCLIVFVEGQYLHKIDDLLERMRNSVTWLNIADERPYFYIFHYGQPVFQLTANDSRKRISKKIKELFNGYSQDEDVCIMAPVQRNARSLIVNHFKKFSLKAS